MVLHKDFPVSPTRCSRQDSKVSGPGLRTAGDLFVEGSSVRGMRHEQRRCVGGIKGLARRICDGT